MIVLGLAVLALLLYFFGVKGGLAVWDLLDRFTEREPRVLVLVEE